MECPLLGAEIHRGLAVVAFQRVQRTETPQQEPVGLLSTSDSALERQLRAAKPCLRIPQWHVVEAKNMAMKVALLFGVH